MLPNVRNLFDPMPTTDDDSTNRFIMENIIFEGGVGGGVDDAAYDLNRTQSQDARGPFMVGYEGTTNTFAQGHDDPDDPFMQGQDGMGSTSPTGHKLTDDYGLEEKDEVDIDGEPLRF
ncbi:DNA repair protein rhp54 [Hordeum vulgare]|nr:DNA repair protein rhp54 [Hordeum vulgare]